jgi:hypothetical protein
MDGAPSTRSGHSRPYKLNSALDRERVSSQKADIPPGTAKHANDVFDFPRPNELQIENDDRDGTELALVRLPGDSPWS